MDIVMEETVSRDANDQPGNQENSTVNVSWHLVKYYVLKELLILKVGTNIADQIRQDKSCIFILYFYKKTTNGYAIFLFKRHVISIRDNDYFKFILKLL